MTEYIAGHKCPRCHSHNVGTGKFDGYATLKNHDRFFGGSSRVLVQVCGDCGQMFDFRVDQPHKFGRRDNDD